MRLVDIHSHSIKVEDEIKVYIHDFNNPQNFQGHICYGIHPWFIRNIDKTIQEIEQYIRDKSFFALGEIGLDRKIQTKLSTQIEVFEKQLELAKKYDLSRLIIHNVGASFDIIPILKNFKIKSKILLHDYNENTQVFNAFAKDFDTYYSTGHQLFKSSTIKRELHKLPHDKLLLETDDQDKYNIKEIYIKCSDVLATSLTGQKISFEKLKEMLFENFQKFST